MVPNRILAGILSAAIVAAGSAATAAPADQPASPNAAGLIAVVQSHCTECHDAATKTAGLALDELVRVPIVRNPEAWERVVGKLASRQMPPLGNSKPQEREYQTAIAAVVSALDARATADPNPGRTDTFRRLTRTEYRNTIRDLLALDVNVDSLLPADESSHDFDNLTVSGLSPALLGRYVSAAQTIGRQAVGKAPPSPRENTFRMRPDITQDVHLEGLPLGTRGGMLIPYDFPQSGEYEIQVRLMRDRNDEIEGLKERHELEILYDRSRVALFPIAPPKKGESDRSVDAELKTRIKATAGPHRVGVTFVSKSSSLLESGRQPLNVHFNFYRHPRLGPAIYQVSIVGPFEASGPGDTPSRARLLRGEPAGGDEEAAARRILSDLVRRAYRRPIRDDDLNVSLGFYRKARAAADFETGIEAALASVLVNPQFLFRIETDPKDAKPGTAYRIDDVALASRLSYFLWSSMPDDELLELAEQGKLGQSDVLERQVRRMLADKRSQSLATNFASQWLHLRNLESFVPDMRLFPDFDDNLRQAMRRETELFFENVVREDRSVLDLIESDHTYLNERLARHYGIPHVYGDRFRRVVLDQASHRGGLLRQASILSVTSYATRTSPVLRGHWVLKNILGTPPPPPPPNVPALRDNTVSASLSVRDRLVQHRADAACASCHEPMDPIGFALENYDAVGRWRLLEAERPIDASGRLPDGSEFTGVAGLEKALLDRPELFVGTLAEKLLTFALGRRVEYYDAPAIRKIVAAARDENYRFSQLILGIVNSTPFRMRTTP